MQHVTPPSEIVRELAREDQFVTTCHSLTRPALDAVDVMRDLDITATNLYDPMQDGLARPVVDE